jgi:hypothetical protein
MISLATSINVEVDTGRTHGNAGRRNLNARLSLFSSRPCTVVDGGAKAITQLG